MTEVSWDYCPNIGLSESDKVSKRSTSAIIKFGDEHPVLASSLARMAEVSPSMPAMSKHALNTSTRKLNALIR